MAALVTAFAGLRGGETFALALRHLRFGSSGVVSHVRIDQSLVELPHQPVIIGPPKSDAGIREVALPEQIGRLLAEHAKALASQPDRLLFTTSTGAPVRSANRCHVMILARARTPGAEHLTWHGLRHTGLTLAASVPGATVRNIMDRGGHSTPRAALIYQHTAASADEQIAAGLNALLTHGVESHAPRHDKHPTRPAQDGAYPGYG